MNQIYGTGRIYVMQTTRKASLASEAAFGLQHLQLEERAQPKETCEERKHRRVDARARHQGATNVIISDDKQGNRQSRHKGAQQLPLSPSRSVQSAASYTCPLSLPYPRPAATHSIYGPKGYTSRSQESTSNTPIPSDRPNKSLISARFDHLQSRPSSSAPSRLPLPQELDPLQVAPAPETVNKPPSVSSRHQHDSRTSNSCSSRTSRRAYSTSTTVPAPSAEYLAGAHTDTVKTRSPQHLLVVLDLNGTLLYRPHAKTNFQPRPGLDQLLEYCLANHSVLIWSSAKPYNVTEICAKLFSLEQRPLILGEWGRDRLNLTSTEYNQRVQVYKRLNEIWTDENVQLRHPYARQGIRWGQHNTVLIDDNAIKASAQPFNHLEVPEFSKQRMRTEVELHNKGIGVLVQLIQRLEEMSWSNNVSAFLRKQSEYPLLRHNQVNNRVQLNDAC